MIFYHYGQPSHIRERRFPRSSCKGNTHDSCSCLPLLRFLARDSSLDFSADGALLACGGISNVSNAFAGIGNPAILLFNWHSGKQKLVLAFDLPRGSYATLIVKRIT